jgi:hypothetical protein
VPRTRTIGESYQTDLKYRWQGDGYASLGSIPGFPSGTLEYQTITDYPGKTGSTFGTGGVRPVFHRTWTYQGLPYQSFIADHGLSIRMSNTEPMYPTGYDLLWSSLPSVSEGLYQGLLLEAFNVFMEQFPQEISIAETVSGLRELGSLIPKFSGDLLRDLATMKLNATFGWDSVLSDLRAFSTLLSNIESRLTWLRETRGKPTKLGHFHGEIHQMAANSVILDIEPIRGFGLRYVCKAFKADFRAGATLHHNLSHLDDAYGFLRALSGALGLDNPVKALWEIMPASFITDYFLNVSARLDNLTKIRSADPWDLQRITHSVKTVAAWDVYQVNNNLINGPANEDQTRKLGVVKLCDYGRWTGLPIQVASFSLSDLNSGQLTLLGALLAAH